MYRHQRQEVETSKETLFRPYMNLGGANSFNAKYFQEMYLETGTPTSPLSLSPSSTDSSTLSSYPSLTSHHGHQMGTSATKPPTTIVAPDSYAQHYTQHNAYARPLAGDTAINSLLTMSPNEENMRASTSNTSVNVAIHQQQQELLLHHRQQQQFLLQQQQQQQQRAVAAMAQQQLALAAAANAANAANQRDEISKSLQMFAMLTAYSTGNEAGYGEAPVDVVMEDFACNGFVADEYTRYKQQYQNLGLGPALSSGSTNRDQMGHATATALQMSSNISQLYQQLWQQQQQLEQQSLLQQHQQQALLHLTDNQHGLQALMPTQFPRHNAAVLMPNATAAAAAATAAAAANIDYNANHNNHNHRKPLQKRFNTAKEKFSAPKHCVFCENNNEPEAVVKSHAVRDILGRVLCPKLRTYICPICKASGDRAHTVKYCPQKPIVTMDDALRAESFRLAKNSYFKTQMKV